jgi:hypothetical protein
VLFLTRNLWYYISNTDELLSKLTHKLHVHYPEMQRYRLFRVLDPHVLCGSILLKPDRGLFPQYLCNVSKIKVLPQ